MPTPTSQPKLVITLTEAEILADLLYPGPAPKGAEAAR